MDAGFRRAIYTFLIIVSSAAIISQAQRPMMSVLPDAPSPIEADGSAGETSPASVETKQNFTPPPSIGMTTRQKYALAYRRIVSPQLPAKAAFVSGWELATGTGPDFPTNGWGPFAERFGYNAATISTTIFFNTAVVPSLVHQDPRYFPLGGGPVKTRILWAIRSEFVGFSDSGQPMPNYANLVGFALSSLVSNAYTPHTSASLGDTSKSYAIKIAVSTGLNVAREFEVFDHVKALVHHSKSADD